MWGPFHQKKCMESKILVLMNTKKKKFNDWYEAQIAQNVVYDNSTELRKYCDIDVTILKKKFV